MDMGFCATIYSNSDLTAPEMLGLYDTLSDELHLDDKDYIRSIQLSEYTANRIKVHASSSKVYEFDFTLV